MLCVHNGLTFYRCSLHYHGFRMKQRILPEISQVGYGAWGIGGNQWLGGRDDESIRALRRAIELDINFIATALAYGGSRNGNRSGKRSREGRRELHMSDKGPPES